MYALIKEKITEGNHLQYLVYVRRTIVAEIINNSDDNGFGDIAFRFAESS